MDINFFSTVATLFLALKQFHIDAFTLMFILTFHEFS